jgi:type IV pilus assembly protein PilW
MVNRTSGNHGYSSIELLVALAMSVIVTAAIMSSLFAQQKVHITQGRILDMQQDLRSAIYLMGVDIKMAGYDPSGSAGATFLIANEAEIQFQIDRNGDGDFTEAGPPVSSDPNELIRYALTNDVDRNGIADGTPCDLGRQVDNGALEVLAENIDALDFVYRDANGDILATPVANPQAISSVQVTLVARSGATLPFFFFKSNDGRSYQNRQGT